jgi:lipopolysaccharide/colanic/teichoic acid biosynthesis glycosyltransferase
VTENTLISKSDPGQRYSLGFLSRRRLIFFDLLPSERRILEDQFKSSTFSNRYQMTSNKDEIGRAVLIVVSRQSTKNFLDRPYLLQAHVLGIPFIDWKIFTNYLNGRIDITHTDLWSYLNFAHRKSLLGQLYFYSKYIFEPLIAVSLFLVSWPVFVAIAAAIKVSGSGPIFYRQLRTGYKGKSFWLYKFRTMHTDAEKNSPQWSHTSDDRVYPLGKWLRKTRLDELPQLWNVIRRDIQFIGPRPERPEFYAKLKEQIPMFELRTLTFPGITGWAQVCGGYAATIEESLQKLEFDLYYIQNASFQLDILILWKTIKGFSDSAFMSLLKPRKSDDPLSQPLQPVLKQSMDR